MRNRSGKWVWSASVGAMVLGAVLFVGTGGGVASAGGQNSGPSPNPFTQILTKLNEILAAIGNIPQNNPTLRWDQVLPAAQRFVVLAAFNNEAVLDKETGLVWEQAPATTTQTWVNARGACLQSTKGGRKGWRLPSVHEQASLIDPSVPAPGPTLPAGHPFTNVQSSGYWSASTFAGSPSLAWNVFFFSGNVLTDVKAGTNHVWCVRGGHNDGSEY